MPTKPKGAGDGIIAFRPDQALRDALSKSAERNKRSIHEEARQRVISTLGEEVSTESETVSGLKESLKVIEQKLDRFAKDMTGPSPELLALREQCRKQDAIVTLIAQDTAMLAFLLISQRQLLDATAAKKWVEANIATHAVGKMSHES